MLITMSHKLITSLAFLLISPVAIFADKTYTIDIEKSKINWSGSKKIGGGHRGSIKFKEGKVQFSAKSFKGTFVVDMDSIICDDLKDMEYNVKLVGHLKSKDFFHVKKYRTAKLVVHELNRGKGDHHTAVGKITIRGITKKIKIPMVMKIKQNSFYAKGILKIDRTIFGVKYNSGKFYKALGDKLINDEFVLNFGIRSK